MLKEQRKNYQQYKHRYYLKDQRESIHMTVEDAAVEIGISSDYYSQIENGFRGKRLSVRLLINISGALKLNICEAIKKEKQFIDEVEKEVKDMYGT